MPARDEGPAETVEHYLARLPEPERKALARLRGQIRKAAPKAEEMISYRIPTYRQNGPLVHFAAQRNHLSLTVVSLSVLETFRAELRGFDVSGRTIHFTPAKPLPAGLVKRVVQARARENEAAARTKPRRTAPAKDHLPRLRRRQPPPLTAAEAEALDEENRGNR